MDRHIAIIGAGQAGATLAMHLRELGHAGRLTMFGDEPYPPYQRPPLSKKYLSGEWGAERLYLGDAQAWKTLDVEIRSNARVTAFDAARKTLEVGGEQIAWDRLALATGAAPRPVPPVFAGRDGVFDLRTMADVDRLRGAFTPGARLAIIGGGFIGLETAAVAVKHGLDVCVIERAGRLMERAVGPATSEAFRALHEAHGVRVLLASGVASVAGDGHVRSLTLLDGTVLPVDLVLIGIGVLPATALAAEAGLATGDGIMVDAYGRTSAPDVWAAGDCACFPYGERVLRLESVQNAIEHAKAVAADMLGQGQPYRPVPWFWSDQYEAKLQIAGLSQGAGNVVTRRSRAGESHWYFKGDQFIAVEAISDAQAFMTGRRLLAAGINVPAQSLADAQFDPRTCLV